jgi:hypothetical protein
MRVHLTRPTRSQRCWPARHPTSCTLEQQSLINCSIHCTARPALSKLTRIFKRLCCFLYALSIARCLCFIASWSLLVAWSAFTKLILLYFSCLILHRHCSNRKAKGNEFYKAKAYKDAIAAYSEVMMKRLHSFCGWLRSIFGLFS